MDALWPNNVMCHHGFMADPAEAAGVTGLLGEVGLTVLAEVSEALILKVNV